MNWQEIGALVQALRDLRFTTSMGASLPARAEAARQADALLAKYAGLDTRKGGGAA